MEVTLRLHALLPGGTGQLPTRERSKNPVKSVRQTLIHSNRRLPLVRQSHWSTDASSDLSHRIAQSCFGDQQIVRTQKGEATP